MTPEWSFFGKSLMAVGMVLFILGLLFSFSGHFHSIPWLGRLPGDISIRRENFSFYFPLVSCLVISALVSLTLWILSIFWRR